jgi:hypothetical protein
MAIQLENWFCLNQGRDNFKPHNLRDSQLVLCHNDLVSDEILSSIEQRFASKEPVKLLICGDWGVGKTHTMNHICWWLDQHKNDYPAYAVMIEIGDITKTSRFDTIVRPFLDKLGLSFLVQLVHAYMQNVTDVVQRLKAADVSPQVADAFSKMLMAPPGQTPPQIVQFAYDYLKGQRLPAAAAGMGFGPSLTESVDLYSVLLAIGVMHRVVHGQQVIFVADEAAKLEAVDTDDATRAHWVNANKLIFDDKNKTFGFIYTISGKRKNLPLALYEPQLQNRLGDNAFEMKNLQPADVGAFLDRLRDNFVDQSSVEQLVNAGTISASEYSWNNYPFTEAGKKMFVDFYSRTQQDAKPRDITNKLNDVAFIAAKSNKRLIDPDCLRRGKL